MDIKEVVETLERFAPLPLQESYDNAGLQIGLTEAEEVSGVLLCLDVTEDVVREAEERGCNLVVSHHPLLFRPLRRVVGATQPERCAAEAIRRGVAVYSAHTNLDNAPGGVNFRMAEVVGLREADFLAPAPDGCSGSGVIGNLPCGEKAQAFLQRIKEAFGVRCLLHNEGPSRLIRRVALCGGSGEFLIDAAVAAGADVFLTGEVGYHRFFGYENAMWIAALGHYQSEQFTIQLLAERLRKELPQLRVEISALNTNPIHYLV